MRFVQLFGWLITLGTSFSGNVMNSSKATKNRLNTIHGFDGLYNATLNISPAGIQNLGVWVHVFSFSQFFFFRFQPLVFGGVNNSDYCGTFFQVDAGLRKTKILACKDVDTRQSVLGNDQFTHGHGYLDVWVPATRWAPISCKWCYNSSRVITPVTHL